MKTNGMKIHRPAITGSAPATTPAFTGAGAVDGCPQPSDPSIGVGAYRRICDLGHLRSARAGVDVQDRTTYNSAPSSCNQSTKPRATAAAQSTSSMISGSCAPELSGTCISA